ncbi:helix-turn-helix domain-containing protein [Paraglaciecola aestuariivivens]
MAKVKPFSREDFVLQLDKTIENLIQHKNCQPDLTPTDIQVQDIAKDFGVHMATLRRWCHEYIGVSPRQYLAMYRVERAKHMLKSGMRPTQIWQALAFTQHKVFSTLFKRLQGNCPIDFIDQQKRLS